MFVTQSTVNITYVKKIDIKKIVIIVYELTMHFRVCCHVSSLPRLYITLWNAYRDFHGKKYMEGFIFPNYYQSYPVDQTTSRVKFDGGWCKYNVRAHFRARDYLGDGLQASTSIQPVTDSTSYARAQDERSRVNFERCPKLSWFLSVS